MNAVSVNEANIEEMIESGGWSAPLKCRYDRIKTESSIKETACYLGDNDTLITVKFVSSNTGDISASVHHDGINYRISKNRSTGITGVTGISATIDDVVRNLSRGKDIPHCSAFLEIAQSMINSWSVKILPKGRKYKRTTTVEITEDDYGFPMVTVNITEVRNELVVYVNVDGNELTASQTIKKNL